MRDKGGDGGPDVSGQGDHENRSRSVKEGPDLALGSSQAVEAPPRAGRQRRLSVRAVGVGLPQYHGERFCSRLVEEVAIGYEPTRTTAVNRPGFPGDSVT
jgi:hypothetical protein